jgi:hypothetical protein
MVSALRKFDEFIALWTKGVFLPYVTLHSLVQDLLENKTLDLTTHHRMGAITEQVWVLF